MNTEIKENTNQTITEDKDKKLLSDILVAKPFDYTLTYGNITQDVSSAVVVIPEGLTDNQSSTKMDAPIYCEDKNGKVIDFNTVEDAEDWIKNEANNCTLEIKYGNEIHAIPNDKVIEDEGLDIKDEVKETSPGDNSTGMVEELQKTLAFNTELEQKIIRLNEKLSVCYAKEADLEEDIVKYKRTISELSESAKSVKALETKVTKLTEELEQRDSHISSLNESLSTSTQNQSDFNVQLKLREDEIIRLTESLNEERNSNEVAVNQLNEELAELKKDYDQMRSSYSSKVEDNNKLVEKYKKTTYKVIDKYIDSKALMLGVSSNDIKRRLPESYSISDIDNIVDEIQDYSLSMNRLPIRNHQLDESMKMKVKASTDDSVSFLRNNTDDSVDDELLALAGLN